jgi:hypothetical protein
MRIDGPGGVPDYPGNPRPKDNGCRPIRESTEGAIGRHNRTAYDIGEALPPTDSPVVHYGRTGDMHGRLTTPPEEMGCLAREEAREFFTGTAKNVLTGLAQFLADAHGFGSALRLARYGVKAVEWVQTGKGSRGFDVGVPFTIGPVGLEVSGHLRGDGPPVTLCAGLSGDSPMGVVIVDGAEVDSGEKLDKAHVSGQAPPEPVTMNCPPPELRSDDPDELIAELMLYVKRNKLRQYFRGSIEYFILWHSAETEAIALFYEKDDARSTWSIVIRQRSEGVEVTVVRRQEAFYPGRLRFEGSRLSP